MCSPPLFTNLPGLWQQQQHKKQQQRQQASMHPPSSHFNGRRAIPMAMSFFNGKVQLQLRHRQLPQQQQQQQHQQQQQQQHNCSPMHATPMAMAFLETTQPITFSGQLALHGHHGRDNKANWLILEHGKGRTKSLAQGKAHSRAKIP
ncbi:unnamed protein product [Polarella glacialis]|uniref:Uncharacterized protein n=1 Tax=Polarella glacialis TaxID=89957 RepID=A0A813I6Q8_POLGL|nr:unnamed protein product [Polarella glacialis]